MLRKIYSALKTYPADLLRSVGLNDRLKFNPLRHVCPKFG
jgi:hypothetical protein